MFVKKHDFFRVSLVGVVNVASIFVASAERRKNRKTTCQGYQNSL